MFCWNSFSLSPVYHTKEDQQSLPDQGIQTCALYERTSARSQNRYKLCSVQVVSQNQIIANSECVSKLKNSRISGSHTLYCGGGVIKTPIKIKGTKVKGNNIISLDKRLPIIPLNLDRDFEFSMTSNKKCFLKSAEQYFNLIPRDHNIRIEGNRIQSKKLTRSDIGAGIYCLGDDGKEILVGVLDENFQVQNLKGIEESNKKNIDEKDIEFILPPKESIIELCTEGVNCIDNIAGQASELTSYMLKVLNELEGQISEIETIKEIDDLERELLEIRLRCNQLNIELGQENTDFVETGILSATMGQIENAAISGIETFSSLFGVGEDFLMNQFQKVPIISENITKKELQEIINKVEAKGPTITSLDKIKNITREVTKKIVTNIANEMDLMRNSEENYRSYISKLLLDFNKCLNIANSKSKILECAEKISNKAAIKISETELDNQIKDNFFPLFENDNKQYEKLKLSSKDTYARCIAKNIFHQDIESSEIAKGCVFEAILNAYNMTKDKIITNYLIEAKTDKEKIPNLLQSIKEKSIQCNLGTIINNEGKISTEEFNGLKKLTTNKFKQNLDNCINKLTLTAGRIVTIQTVFNHPQIRSAISSNDNIQKVVDTIVVKDYDDCITAQSNSPKQDPNNCRDLITAMTSLHVAKNVMAQTIKDMSDKNYNLENKLTNDTNAVIDSCSEELRKKHINSIKNNTQHPEEADTVNCLNLAVGGVARAITHETLTQELESNQLLKEFKEQIIKEDKIITIPQVVKECFQTKLESSTTIDDFTKTIDQTKQQCQLEAEKIATATIAPIIITAKLQEALEESTVANSIAKDYIEGKTGLGSRIANVSKKEELVKITNNITGDLTLEGAKYLIPKLVDEMLNESNEILKAQTKDTLLNDITNCIKRTQNTEICVNKSTALGYEKIGGIIIAQNITNVLAPDQKIKNKLISQSAERLQKCIDKIDTQVANEKYKETINMCMIDEIAILSIELPREALILYAPAAGLNKSKKKLRETLVSYEDFYLLKTRQLPKRTDDFIIDSHISHMSCIAAVRYDLKKRNETDMTKVQAEYSRCTNSVEQNIKTGIVEIFVDKHLSDPSIRPELHSVGRTLLQLTSNEKKEEDSIAPLDETFQQMHLLGDKFETACKYDRSACKEASKNTLIEISAYKVKNPNATSEEILNKFYETELMSVIIKSEIGVSLQSELSKAMESYMDSEGILENALKDITSYESISQLLSSEQGKKVKDKIIQSIKENNIDKLMENKEFRKDFSKALIDNQSNNSFVDKLMYGIVQPAVRKEKSSSNGPLGIFKNPKVTLGRLLGIVDGKDFDWNKIRNTKDGKVARQIFANEIFAPLVAGENLDNIRPYNTKKYKNRLEELTDKVQDNIIKGIKSL